MNSILLIAMVVSIILIIAIVIGLILSVEMPNSIRLIILIILLALSFIIIK